MACNYEHHQLVYQHKNMSENKKPHLAINKTGLLLGKVNSINLDKLSIAYF
jgi:hypothetical protein